MPQNSLLLTTRPEAATGRRTTEISDDRIFADNLDEKSELMGEDEVAEKVISEAS